MKQQQVLKLFKTAPIELIMCPYCGARLNRVGKENLLPTSCTKCSKSEFTPTILQVLDVADIKED